MMPFLVFLAATAAPTGAPNTDALVEGLRLFEDLQYEAAMPHLAAAKTDATRPVAERARAAVHLAIIQISLGDEESARRNIGEAVELDRDVKLPAGASPRIQTMLSAARDALPAEQEPGVVPIRHIPPAAGVVPATVVIEVEPAAATQLAHVTLHFRGAGTSAWQSGELSLTGEGRFEAMLPTIAGAKEVEYYVEATRTDGAVAGRAGSPELPLRFVTDAAPEPPPTTTAEAPIYRTWWFWTAAGVVVAGGTVAAVLLLRSDSDDNNSSACGDAGQGCVEVTY
jgi:hypothetical protein